MPAYERRSSLVVTCLVVMAGTNLAFMAPASRAPMAAPSVQPPRAPASAGASPLGVAALGANSSTSSMGPLCAAAAAAAVALGGRVLAKAGERRRNRGGVCAVKAFGSSSSGFMGSPAASTSIVVAEGPAVDDYSNRNGAGGMGMRGQVWWITGQTLDNRPAGQVNEWPRRESRRRGDEDFRHDVDNFELHSQNLICAPGSVTKKKRRGRGKYGNMGRTCGYGQKGALSRGRRRVNPGYEGGRAPLHITTPKLLPAHKAMMRTDPYSFLSLKDLNNCEDGDEVDFQELIIRGFDLKLRRKYPRVKVKGADEDSFSVKNLTVYAHAFEPPAREKIENLGGKCVRLHAWTNLPLDPTATQVNAEDLGAADGEPTDAKEDETPADEGESAAEE